MLKEKIAVQKYLEAESVRQFHLDIDNTIRTKRSLPRERLDRNTEIVKNLQKKLKVYWEYSQSRDIVRKRSREFEKLEDTEMVVRKVQRTLLGQDKARGKQVKSYRLTPIPSIQKRKERLMKNLEDSRPSKLFSYSRDSNTQQMMKKIYFQRKISEY